jgi:small subunit ribosomal protein S20
MAHHKSAIQRIKTNKKSQEYNSHYKSMLKTLLKKIFSIKDKEQGISGLKEAYSLLDTLAKKNIIHKNKAAHQKARVARHIISLS